MHMWIGTKKSRMDLNMSNWLQLSFCSVGMVLFLFFFFSGHLLLVSVCFKFAEIWINFFHWIILHMFWAFKHVCDGMLVARNP